MGEMEINFLNPETADSIGKRFVDINYAKRERERFVYQKKLLSSRNVCLFFGTAIAVKLVLTMTTCFFLLFIAPAQPLHL